MYFGFTTDQLALRDGLRDLLGSACPPDVVRAAWQQKAGSDLAGEGAGALAAPWAELAELGLLGVLASPELGGLGGTELDLVLLLEECGRHAVPGPLTEHAAVAVPALVAAGHPAAARAAAGVTVVSASSAPDATVPAADAADAVLLVGPDEVALAERGELRIGPPIECVDRSLRLFDVTATAATPLSGADAALARDRASLAIAAQLLGLAERMIELTVGYARVRTQFGVAIGTQQAVKHHLASAAIALAHARPVVYRAAYAVAQDEPRSGRDVSHAKVYATRAAQLAGRVALQCHGAIGYTWEHDLHLWVKRVWALAPRWGTLAEHERRVADAVLGPV